MDDGNPAVHLISFLILLTANMIFYGFGSAIQSLNESLLKEKAEANNKKAKKILEMTSNPGSFINTIQLVVTLVTIVMGAFYLNVFKQYFKLFIEFLSKNQVPVFSKMGMDVVGYVAILLTGFVLVYIILTFSVLVPKKIAMKYPEKWAFVFVDFIYVIMFLFKPITSMVVGTTNLFVRLFGIHSQDDNLDVTEEEIISMVNEGHEQGVLQASEAEMITNIFEFTDKDAKEIMTHRSSIVGIDGETSLKEAVMFMLNEKNSRYPVYVDNIDHIIGIIHIKDAFKILEEGADDKKPIKSFKHLIREAKFIPETHNIDTLFRNMQSLKTHMVIVIDEYGQTSGLVAMEDILEEIVGNILDEYDEDENFIQEKGDDEYELDGLTPLDELGEKLGINFDSEEFDTINGLMISKLERIPEENETFDMDYDGYHFKVLHVENKMIKKVLVTKLVPDNKGEN